MSVEVYERKGEPGVWAVEEINDEGDGEVYLTVFSGPDAKFRADEYWVFKYAY